MRDEVDLRWVARELEDERWRGRFLAAATFFIGVALGLAIGWFFCP